MNLYYDVLKLIIQVDIKYKKGYISNMYEERKFTRYSTNIICEVNYPNESVQKQLHLKNVSLGGMAFESDIEWEIGTLINIQLLFNPLIKVIGKVIRCSFNGNLFDIGIKLNEKYSEDKQLQDYKNMIATIIENVHTSWD